MLDDDQERHLVELNANIRTYDNPHDVESDAYNQLLLHKIRNPPGGPSSTLTSASVSQAEVKKIHNILIHNIFVTFTNNDLPQYSHLGSLWPS